jgi:hypothetical protein
MIPPPAAPSMLDAPPVAISRPLSASTVCTQAPKTQLNTELSTTEYL